MFMLGGLHAGQPANRPVRGSPEREERGSLDSAVPEDEEVLRDESEVTVA